MAIKSKEQLFHNILNESTLLNEKRVELQNKHPVTKDEIFRFLNNSDRIQWRGNYDSKTQRIYIKSTDRNGKERYDLLGEVEPTSIGYVLHGRDGYCYQGESYEDFKNDMKDAIRHFDFNVFDTLGGSGEDIFNEELKYDAGYALTKLKGYLKFDTRWEYDGDGEPYLVDNENEPPLYTVQWTAKESGSHQGFYSVEVEQDGEWDSTVYNFSDVRSTYEKIEDVMKSSKLLEGKGDFKRYAMLGGAAAAVLGLGALKVGDIKDIKSKADELNIKVPAIEYVSSHRDAQLVRPIYDYKYDNKGPLNIESLCKWLERHTEFENVWYEEDGDNYTIKYRNSYYSYADDSSNPKRKTTYGKLDLPKSYFDDWTYSLDENKKIALFDKLLKE